MQRVPDPGQLLGCDGRVGIAGELVVEVREVARRFVGSVVVHGTQPLLSAVCSLIAGLGCR